MNSKVDLHMHSRASDGSDWIPGLLRKIQKLGIRTFALTDHDTIKGVQRMEKIVPDGIRFIRGIELSCKTEVAKCHILGYNYDLKQKEFLDFVAEAYGVRINKTHNRLRYMEEEFGFQFTAEEKEAQLKNPGKLQLKLLLEKKLRQLHPGAEPVDIFATYFKNLPSGRVDADAGIAGLECYYSEYTAEESEMLRQAAMEQGLRISGGSDYHGRNKKHLHLGMLNKDDAIVTEDKLSVLKLLR